MAFLGEWAKRLENQLDQAMGLEDQQQEQGDWEAQLHSQLEDSSHSSTDQQDTTQPESKLDELQHNSDEHHEQDHAEEILEQSTEEIVATEEESKDHMTQHENNEKKDMTNLEREKEELINLVRELKKKNNVLRAKLKESVEDSEKIRHRAKISTKQSDRVQELQLSIVEKDKQIAGVLKEGEALARKQNKLEMLIKNLRAGLKEKDQQIEQISTDLTVQTARCHDLEESLNQIGLTERDRSDALGSMSIEIDTLQSQLEKKESSWIEASTKLHHFQDLCDQQSQDLERLQAENSETKSRLENLDQERQEISESARGTEIREVRLLENVRELRMQIENMDHQYALKEEQSQKEIMGLRGRLNESERRNDELALSIPQATRPLVKQIDALNSMITVRTDAWDASEKNFRQDIARMRDDLTKAERKCDEWRIRCERYESTEHEQIRKIQNLKQLIAGHKEKESKLTAKVSDLEDRLYEAQATVKTFSRRLEVIDIEKEKEFRVLEDELNQLIAERDSLKQQLTAEETKRLEVENLANHLEHKYSAHRNSFDMIPASVGAEEKQYGYLGHRKSSQGDMHRQRSGEIQYLRRQLSEVESIRDSLTEELVLIKSANRKMESQVLRYEQLEAKVRNLNVRYEAALDVISSKEEELQETRSELMEVKDVFRQQISDLLDQVQELQSK